MTTSNLSTRFAGRHTVPMLAAAGLTALALTLSGCADGIGGGARSRLSVQILPDADAEEDAGPAASGGAVEIAGYGTLKGRVILDGSVSPPGPITPSKDAFCIAKAPIPNDRIEVGAGGGVGNVFVYLPKAPAGTKQPETLDPVKFDQQGCRFVPHCLVVQTGQQIQVLNSDGTLHNTNVSSQKNTKQNLAVAPNTTTGGVPFNFARAEKVPATVTCDIHPWMTAFHLPLDHPYGVVTAADGTFEIPNLPAGTHEFTIWHEVPKVVNGRYKVEIPVDGTAEVEIKIPAQQLSRVDGPASRRVVLSMIP